MTTRLRQRVIENMQLCGLAERTQFACVRDVRRLAEHQSFSPDHISEINSGSACSSSGTKLGSRAAP